MKKAKSTDKPPPATDGKHEPFSNEEWESFEVNESFNEGHPDAEKFILQVCREDSGKHRRTRLLTALKVAAVILCIVSGISIYLIRSTSRPVSSTVPDTLANGAELAEIINTTPISKHVILPDSSVAILSPGAKLIFPKGFTTNSRDIKLTGEALFKVFKDTRRPFTVFCGNVATTALGTIFKVSQRTVTSETIVSLLEGKIVVQSKDSASDKKSYYLLPGNQIAYNHLRKSFKYLTTEDQRPGDKNVYATAEPDGNISTGRMADAGNGQTVSKTAEKSAFTFKNQPLTSVLDHLAQHHKVEIIYPTDKVATINFIGSFSKNTEVRKVLKDIALMNNLSLTVDSVNNRYILR